MGQSLDLTSRHPGSEPDQDLASQEGDALVVDPDDRAGVLGRRILIQCLCGDLSRAIGRIGNESKDANIVLLNICAHRLRAQAELTRFRHEILLLLARPARPQTDGD